MGKRLKDIYPHATPWQVFKYKVRRFTISLFTWIFIVGAFVGVYKLGGLFNPATIVTQAEVIHEVKMCTAILDRIAKCESPTGHYKNGQVVMMPNSDRSVDVGKYQINNKTWGAKAAELGLDITKEADNEAMAHWIYENHGTEDWKYSKACWSKN